MAKKGNRIQVILECTEHKASGMPGTSRYITTKNKKNPFVFTFRLSQRTITHTFKNTYASPINKIKANKIIVYSVSYPYS